MLELIYTLFNQEWYSHFYNPLSFAFFHVTHNSKFNNSLVLHGSTILSSIAMHENVDGRENIIINKLINLF